jgi:hypothetical protein
LSEILVDGEWLFDGYYEIQFTPTAAGNCCGASATTEDPANLSGSGGPACLFANMSGQVTDGGVTISGNTCCKDSVTGDCISGTADCDTGECVP